MGLQEFKVSLPNLEGNKYIGILLKQKCLNSPWVLGFELVWINTSEIVSNLIVSVFILKQTDTQHAFQVLAATYVSCPPSIPRAISVFVQRGCFFYLRAHVVVSMLGEMGLASEGTFHGMSGNNVASVFGSIAFDLTTYFDNESFVIKRSWLVFYRAKIYMTKGTILTVFQCSVQWH